MNKPPIIKHGRAAAPADILIVEYVETADMPDGQPLPPHIDDDGAVWHVVDRADASTRWRRVSLAENPRPDCRQVAGARKKMTRKFTHKTTRRQRRISMDMRKFSSPTFLKVNDVRDGPLQLQIAAVNEGKYEKPDLVFETGETLSLNATNVNTLIRAYGSKSEDWIGKQIELALGLTGEPPPRSNGKDHRHAPKQVVMATFEYQNENGAVAYVIDRVEYQIASNGSFLVKGGKHKKVFRQRRPDPDHSGEWIWNVDGVAKIPYRLPELIEAVASEYLIYIAEGEGKVDTLREIGIAATTNPGGAGKWQPEFNQYLRGADVVLLPDNDEPGWKHINDIGASLAGIAGRVRVLALPNLAAKGDIRNWLDAGGTREQLDALVEQAPDWQPPPAEVPVDIAIEFAQNVTGEVDEDAVLERLEKLPPGVKLAREIKRAAKQLGVSQDAINDELEARRGEKVVAPLQNWIVEPWPEPVDGDSLLRDIVRRIRWHIVCSHDDALAIALWVMFAWVHDAVATHSPILNINSAEPESGKSTTLGLISFLVPRCVSSVEISEAALYRAIELWQPCFVIDEFELGARQR